MHYISKTSDETVPDYSFSVQLAHIKHANFAKLAYYKHICILLLLLGICISCSVEVISIYHHFIQIHKQL